MIRSIQTLLVPIPTIREHKLACTVMREQLMVLVHIQTNDGYEGWGEATTIGGLSYAEESPHSIKTNIDTYFTPLLIKERPTSTAQAMHLLNKNINGNRFAKCAIETALLDIEGKRLGVPISELLGGRVRDQLEVAWTLASGNTDTDIIEAKQVIEAKRHRIFKLKIGSRSIAKDVEHVIAIKQALPDCRITVDLNQAWTELDAMKGIKLLQDGGVDLIEQPISMRNPAGLKRLKQHFDVAIMADEIVQDPQNAFYLAANHCADVFAVKINQAGGLKNACLIGQMAHLAGIELYGGTMLEGPIGTAASAHVFSTYPSINFDTELFGPLLLTDDILTKPLDYNNFGLTVPTGPGLGIEVNADKVYDYAERNLSRASANKNNLKINMNA
ncbi:muconate/chloromuconate family cycloisomerase [Psychrobacter alimentarius]|uniref:muconate/chloromuconate family cycloisomerase n=1 Tax=Psychrobacter alimentarius TaxID=261164 RepID=UPI00191A40FA|nr:muconate/chloromuconate family cycloisomerase [Psychrobacter alimentarius]